VFGLAIAMSIAGLMIGPAITAWAHGRSAWLRGIDAAMLGVVLPLLLLRLIPHVVDEIGAIAVAAVVAGYFAFSLLEARAHTRSAQLGAAILLPTLGIHSFLDGTALAIAFQHGGNDAAGATLGAALVLHRIPEGLVIARALVPTVGVRGALLRVSALAAMTITGALIGVELLERTPDRALHVIVAAGLGVMLRMVVHTHDHHDAANVPRRDWIDGTIFVVALLAAWAVPSLADDSQPNELSAARAIVPLFLETAPSIVGALVLAELADRFVIAPGPRGWPAGWLVGAVLATFWLGPWFAVAVATLGPAVVWLGSRRGVSLDAAIPRASALLPAYVAGVVIALTIEATVPADALGGLGWIGLPLALAAAAAAPMCVAGLVPIAAILVHKGLWPELGLAFTLAGVAFAARDRARALSWRTVAVAAAAAAAALPLAPLLAAVPELHALGEHHHHPVEYASGIILAAWIVVELIRRGPRPFLAAIR
jgi:zinc transporter ZupT